MTEEIIIDVSNCPHKRDDDCMEVPICNEYGDLMGYQSCEAQILCPYRSQKKIERLEQENEELKEKIIKLTEENGNLIINRNTVENKLRDTESRLIFIQKANTHNLVLLQSRNYVLEEIRELAEKSIEISYNLEVNSMLYDIIHKIHEVLK